MSRFPLRVEHLEIRGTPISVRELTFPQKAEWVKRVEQDPLAAAYSLISIVCEPAVSEEEAAQWPSQVVEQICNVAQRISGMETREAPGEKND